MSRLALISDIHGNGVALDTVLAAIARENVDDVICLGDLAAGGPQPREVISRLRELDCQVVRGNADCWLLTGLPPGRSDETRRLDDAVAWARKRLAADDCEYLAALPATLRVSTGGLDLFCFHGSPSANTDSLLPTTPAAKVDRLLTEAPAVPLLAAGHTGVRRSTLTRWGGDGRDAARKLGPRPRDADRALERPRMRRGDLARLAPDRLPLRPLATRARLPPGPREPRWQYRFVTSEQHGELGRGEEVDVEAPLRAGAVADREAAVAVALDHVVGVLEVGADGIDANGEEPTRQKARLCRAHVRVRGGAVAVLEDLDSDHEWIRRPSRQRRQVAVDKTAASLGCALGKLLERALGDIEADEIEPGVDEREVVAAVAAADVDALARDQVVSARRRDDVRDERQRRLVAIAAGRIFDIPGVHRRVVVKLCRHRPIVVDSDDGARTR